MESNPIFDDIEALDMLRLLKEKGYTVDDVLLLREKGYTVDDVVKVLRGLNPNDTSSGVGG